MKPLQPASFDQGPGGDAPDGLDRLLARFFRATMPDPWPVWKAPSRDPLPVGRVSSRRLLSRSRTALAASLLLLLGGLILLGGRFTAPTLPVSRDAIGDTADKPDPRTGGPHRPAPKPGAEKSHTSEGGLSSSRRP
jgi:hypothetical protein